MNAREAILGRVREALADVPAEEHPEDVEVPRDYARSSPLDPGAVLELFVENVRDYGAGVTVVSQDAIALALREVAVRHGLGSILVPPGFPEQWVTAAGLAVIRGEQGMRTSTLDSAGGVITTAEVGIAETGTLVLVSGPGMGTRVMSLLPDVHVCVIRTEQVVATVPEAMDRLGPRRLKPITFISGGSATSDIELVRVEGVHGPRTLEVLLVSDTGGEGATGIRATR